MKHFSTPPTAEENKSSEFPDWHRLLVCPRCRRTLTFEEAGGKIISLALTCSGCNLVFPIREQIPVMVYAPEECVTLVDEIVRYHNFYQRILQRRIEKDRLAFKNEEVQFSLNLLKKTFNSALNQIDFSRSPLVLDVGAAFCETSAMLARRGARVVAIDFSPLDFYNPRFFSLGEHSPTDFFDVFATQPAIDPHKEGFRRILCDVHYMPFVDNLFDVVFIRSSLHHCYNPRRAMAEINRVLKPGGRLIIVAEPCRSVLHSEKDYFKKGLDYQEGIREQSFIFSFYPGLFRGAGFGLEEFEVFFPSAGEPVMRLLRALGLGNPFAFLQGRRLTGRLKPWILLFVDSALNIYSVKLRAIEKTHTPEASREKSYCAEMIQELNYVLARYTPHQKSIPEIKRLHRRLLSKAGKLSSELSLAHSLPQLSGFGFRDPTQISSKRGRFIFRDCTLFLSRREQSTRLHVELFIVPTIFNATSSPGGVRFFINDEQVSPLSPLTTGWQIVSFALPPYRQDESSVIEFRIEQEQLVPVATEPEIFDGIEPGAEVGIALSRLWQS